MAIYRPPKPRWPAVAVAAFASVLAGFLIGWLAFGRSEPDPEEALRDLEASLTAAASTLEIVAIEYSESVEDGKVVNEVEYQGAVDALARSRATFAEERSALAVIDPSLVDDLDGLYDQLEGLLDDRAAAEEVTAKTEELAQALGSILAGTTS